MLQIMSLLGWSALEGIPVYIRPGAAPQPARLSARIRTGYAGASAASWHG
jgi:hypothetical protein